MLSIDKIFIQQPQFFPTLQNVQKLRVLLFFKNTPLYDIFFKNPAKSFLLNFYGSVISGCASSNPNLKSYLMHRFTIEMTDDLTRDIHIDSIECSKQSK